MCKRFHRLPLTILLTGLFLLPVLVDARPQELSGTVSEPEGNPVVGATVVLTDGSAIIAGTISDQKGAWKLKLPLTLNENLLIRISAVGYTSSTTKLSFASDIPLRLNTILKPELIDVGSVRVTARRQLPVGVRQIDSTSITASAQQTLVPTNVTAAVRQPLTVRLGSLHSSQVRVNGTSPQYHLNGVPIGADPDHFGMFSIIPNTVVDKVELRTHPRFAMASSPATVQLYSGSRFLRHSNASVQLGTVEATVTGSAGTDDRFILASARHSIIDLLVNQFDLSSQDRSIPPTKFKDFFLSSGWKQSGHSQLFIDGYHSRDHLTYNLLESGITESPLETVHRSTDSYLALRHNLDFAKWQVKNSLSIRSGSKSYRAMPQNFSMRKTMNLDLHEKRRQMTASSEFAVFAGDITFRGGTQHEFVFQRDVTMTQEGWNFLPPFAPSDNPHPFYWVLNTTYDTLNLNQRETNGSAFASLGMKFGKVSVEAGLRQHYFSSLADQWETAFRATASYEFTSNLGTVLSYGTYFENPASTILEPYQPLIRAVLPELTSLRSELTTIGLAWKGINVGGFYKHQQSLPVVTPDYSHINSYGAYDENFLRARSTGLAEYFGVWCEADMRNLIGTKFDAYLSYAYSQAVKREDKRHELMRHEQDVPHRFQANVSYRLTSNFTTSASMDVRSGFPYSPSRMIQLSDRQTSLEPANYDAMLAEENSLRFPIHYYLSLSATYQLGPCDVLLTVTNVTNRANPVVNSSNGFIYDAGLLPGLSLRWKL